MYYSLWKGRSSDPIERLVDEAMDEPVPFESEATRKIPSKTVKPIPIAENDRRQHQRFSVSTGEGLDVSFGSIQAFAKSYVRDISLGGAYIQTEMRPSMGSLLPINFRVEQNGSSEPLVFELRGQVVRHGSDGIGLKFTNLEGQVRRSLEDFLAQNMSSPIPSQTPAKKTTLGRVADIRHSAEDARLKRNAFLTRVAILVLGLILNAWLGMELKTELKKSLDARDAVLTLDSGRKVPLREIQGLKMTDDGIELVVKGSEHIQLSSEEERQLPAHLLLSSKASLKGKEQSRHSRNNPRARVRLR